MVELKIGKTTTIFGVMCRKQIDTDVEKLKVSDVTVIIIVVNIMFSSKITNCFGCVMHVFALLLRCGNSTFSAYNNSKFPVTVAFQCYCKQPF